MAQVVSTLIRRVVKPKAPSAEKQKENLHLMGASPEQMRQIFQPETYIDLYDDIRAAGIDPFQHYITHGWCEERKPMRDFDPVFYRDRYMGGAKDICPLAHYIMQGRKNRALINQGQLETYRWFGLRDDTWRNEMTRVMTAFGHDPGIIATHGFGPGLRGMFSAPAYRMAKGLDDQVTDDECFLRYVAVDMMAGMSPGPLFDADVYLAALSARGMTHPGPDEVPFLHWIRHGLSRGIISNKLFAANEYLGINPDLKGYPNGVFEHFISHGLDEERNFLRDVVIARPPGKTGQIRAILDVLGRDHAGLGEYGAIRQFRNSPQMKQLVEAARTHEPDIGSEKYIPSILPPWHDEAWLDFKRCLAKVPQGQFGSVVLVPFGKIGGADYVAGILAKALSQLQGPVLIIQTEQSDWVRPDWYGDVARADLSAALAGLDQQRKSLILYQIISKLRPQSVFNVNSRLGFDTMVRFGRQLKHFTQTYCYYFCADRMPEGIETGYPVWYFAPLFGKARAIGDSRNLIQTLAERYSVPKERKDQLTALATPAMTDYAGPPMAQDMSPHARPTLIWAGRFDRQKRVDILVDVARLMPDVDFLCWGKAVLDAAPDFSDWPTNIKRNGAFTSYDELPLKETDGFFYTSDWDGIPTILIELGAMGVPMIASASGGVPELIGSDRGWTVPVGSTPQDYVDAIRQMLADPAERLRRASALQDYVREQHSFPAYVQAVDALLKERCDD